MVSEAQLAQAKKLSHGNLGTKLATSSCRWRRSKSGKEMVRDAVRREPVSTLKFPDFSEFTGNFRPNWLFLRNLIRQNYQNTGNVSVNFPTCITGNFL